MDHFGDSHRREDDIKISKLILEKQQMQVWAVRNRLRVQ
jgi:hypothetical protein